MLNSLKDFKIAKISQTIIDLNSVIEEINKIKKLLPSEDKFVIEIIEIIISGFINLCNWAQATINGDSHAERFLRAAKAQTTIASEAYAENRFPGFTQSSRQTINLIKNFIDLDSLKDIAASIQTIPVPVFQIIEEDMFPSRSNKNYSHSSQIINDDPFVIKVMFEIDRKPWSTPQIIRSNTIYDLNAIITIPKWPNNTDKLVIDYVSTLSKDQYRISLIEIMRPKDNNFVEFKERGHAEFPVAQDIFSEPLVMRVRATFHSSKRSDNIPATVVGYHQLRLKVSDKNHTPILARYKSIDVRNVEIINQITQEIPGINQDHLNDFIEALGAVTNYLGVNLQQALYKGKTDIEEKDFQASLLYHMRTYLGEEVLEAPEQGGGITDIKFKTVTIELKVEKQISERSKMIAKYLPQPTQYASVDGSQLGILCILDLTKKQKPPASSQNQITIETPDVHGFPNGNAPYPTKICVVFFDGNLISPSDYSKNKNK